MHSAPWVHGKYTWQGKNKSDVVIHEVAREIEMSRRCRRRLVHDLVSLDLDRIGAGARRRGENLGNSSSVNPGKLIPAVNEYPSLYTTNSRKTSVAVAKPSIDFGGSSAALAMKRELFKMTQFSV